MTCSRSPSCWTNTSASLARACLMMLASPSETTKYATASIIGGGRRGTSTVSRTGIGIRAATPDRAASRPRSSRTAGCRPRMRSRSSARAALASSCASAIAWFAWSALPGLGPGHAQVHGERHQPLLRAVVQVALEAAPLGVRRVDHAGPRLGELLHPVLQLLGAARAEQRLARPGVE